MNKILKVLLWGSTTVASALFIHKGINTKNKINNNVINNATKVVEESFAGVKKSVLNRIAEECRPGGYVSIVGDKLYYHFKSGRGHSTNHAEYVLDAAGKLQRMTIGGYPGQLSFPDVDFLKKVNALLGK